MENLSRKKSMNKICALFKSRIQATKTTWSARHNTSPQIPGRKKVNVATRRRKNEVEELTALNNSDFTIFAKEMENIPYIDEEVTVSTDPKRNKPSCVSEPLLQKEIIVKRIAGTSAVEIRVKNDIKDTHCHVMIQTSERCKYLYEFLGHSLEEEIIKAEKRAKAKAIAVNQGQNELDSLGRT